MNLFDLHTNARFVLVYCRILFYSKNWNAGKKLDLDMSEFVQDIMGLSLKKEILQTKNAINQRVVKSFYKVSNYRLRSYLGKH